MINRNFKDFKFQHKRNKNQILFTSKKIIDDFEIVNLINNFLKDKNSFIFESVEKGIIRGRYTIFGKKPDKIWELTKNKILVKNDKKIMYEKLKFKYNNDLLKKINTKNFSDYEFTKLINSKELKIEKAQLKSINDDSKFNINSIKLIYSMPLNSYTLISDNMYQSYDYLLNEKYKVKINQKTLERVKNYYR